MTHDGHRERLRNRFLNSASSFEDHELIELILFYSIPRKNTNEIAHRLLNRFGSIKGILDASVEALTEVDDIGLSTAVYLKAIANLVLKYRVADQKPDDILKSPTSLSSFLKTLFIGTENESSYILLFDNSKRLLTCTKIGEGFSMEHTISLRKAAQTAITSNAASAILVHNHPNGKAFPSGEDIHATNRAKMVLEALGVVLMEHFIIANNECRPIMNPQKADIFN